MEIPEKLDDTNVQQKPKPNKTKLIVTLAVVALAVVAGGAYFALTQGEQVEKPPSLELGGQAFLGSAVLGQYYTITAGPIPPEAVLVPRGVNYVSQLEDMTVTQILDSIYVEEDTQMMIAHYSPVEEIYNNQNEDLTTLPVLSETVTTRDCYHGFPPGPYSNVCEITIPDFIIEALRTSAIISQKDFYIVPPLFPATEPAPSVYNPPNTVTGWINIPGTGAPVDMSEALRSRITSFWVQSGQNDYVVGDVLATSLPTVYNSWWLKIGEGEDIPPEAPPAEPEPEGPLLTVSRSQTDSDDRDVNEAPFHIFVFEFTTGDTEVAIDSFDVNFDLGEGALSTDELTTNIEVLRDNDWISEYPYSTIVQLEGEGTISYTLQDDKRIHEANTTIRYRINTSVLPETLEGAKYTPYIDVNTIDAEISADATQIAPTEIVGHPRIDGSTYTYVPTPEPEPEPEPESQELPLTVELSDSNPPDSEVDIGDEFVMMDFELTTADVDVYLKGFDVKIQPGGGASSSSVLLGLGIQVFDGTLWVNDANFTKADSEDFTSYTIQGDGRLHPANTTTKYRLGTYVDEANTGDTFKPIIDVDSIDAVFGPDDTQIDPEFEIDGWSEVRGSTFTTYVTGRELNVQSLLLLTGEEVYAAKMEANVLLGAFNFEATGGEVNLDSLVLTCVERNIVSPRPPCTDKIGNIRMYPTDDFGARESFGSYSSDSSGDFVLTGFGSIGNISPGAEAAKTIFIRGDMFKYAVEDEAFSIELHEGGVVANVVEENINYCNGNGCTYDDPEGVQEVPLITILAPQAAYDFAEEGRGEGFTEKISSMPELEVEILGSTGGGIIGENLQLDDEVYGLSEANTIDPVLVFKVTNRSTVDAWLYKVSVDELTVSCDIGEGASNECTNAQLAHGGIIYELIYDANSEVTARRFVMSDLGGNDSFDSVYTLDPPTGEPQNYTNSRILNAMIPARGSKTFAVINDTTNLQKILDTFWQYGTSIMRIEGTANPILTEWQFIYKDSLSLNQELNNTDLEDENYELINYDFFTINPNSVDPTTTIVTRRAPIL